MHHKGVVLGLYASDPGFDYAASLDEISHVAADTVLLLVRFPQPTIHSDTVSPMPEHDRDVLKRVISQARSRHLEVGVIPIVDLAEIAKGRWRGTLAPPDWKIWFDSYREALLVVARIAEDEGATFLTVGSELCSSEAETRQWTRTIEAVRRVFSGRLTYSANWDHLPYDAFVEKLDYLGLNAYYELVCDGQDSTLEVLTDGWQRVAKTRILPWQRHFDKPLLFLEVGYPSVTGADRYPWDYTVDRPLDLQVQERLYVAFTRAWQTEASLAGTFFYVWWEGPHRDEKGYTPRGKPAGDYLGSWYRSLPTTAGLPR